MHTGPICGNWPYGERDRLCRTAQTSTVRTVMLNQLVDWLDSPMTKHSTDPLPPATRLVDASDVLPSATCPMCHTPASVTQATADAVQDWRCTRCGQQWDAKRLTAVAAYAAWTVDHDRVASGGRL